MGKKKCTKQRFAFKNLAVAAGARVHRKVLDVRPRSAFRCSTCRYPDGRRAWHWGHRQSSSRRKQW